MRIFSCGFFFAIAMGCTTTRDIDPHQQGLEAIRRADSAEEISLIEVELYYWRMMEEADGNRSYEELQEMRGMSAIAASSREDFLRELRLIHISLCRDRVVELDRSSSIDHDADVLMARIAEIDSCLEEIVRDTSEDYLLGTTDAVEELKTCVEAAKTRIRSIALTGHLYRKPPRQFGLLTEKGNEVTR